MRRSIGMAPFHGSMCPFRRIGIPLQKRVSIRKFRAVHVLDRPRQPVAHIYGNSGFSEPREEVSVFTKAVYVATHRLKVKEWPKVLLPLSDGASVQCAENGGVDEAQAETKSLHS